MARLSVAAAGNAEENINLINARFQAEALRVLRGYDAGVLDNSFYATAKPRGDERDANADFMWKLTGTNASDIAIGRGMATAYGYDIQSESTVHLTATPPSAGDKYVFVYLEWDLENPVEAAGKIDIHDNGSSESWTPPRQDNLITSPLGVYQMPLYRLKINTEGNITSTQSWSTMGVKTVGSPLYAIYAGRAADSDNADYAKGETGNTTIKSHIDTIYNRLNQLGFKQASISITKSGYIDAANTKIYQFGKILYGYITIDVPHHTYSTNDETLQFPDQSWQYRIVYDGQIANIDTDVSVPTPTGYPIGVGVLLGGILRAWVPPHGNRHEVHAELSIRHKGIYIQHYYLNEDNDDTSRFKLCFFINSKTGDNACFPVEVSGETTHYSAGSGICRIS